MEGLKSHRLPGQCRPREVLFIQKRREGQGKLGVGLGEGGKAGESGPEGEEMAAEAGLPHTLSPPGNHVPEWVSPVPFRPRVYLWSRAGRRTGLGGGSPGPFPSQAFWSLWPPPSQ